MFTFQEPLRGKSFIKYLYNLMQDCDFLIQAAPIFSDIFVFSYPFLLIGIYFYGIYKTINFAKVNFIPFQRSKKSIDFLCNKKNIQTKLSVLFVFFSVFFSSLFTIFIQLFIDKKRPIYEFGFIQENSETILHQLLPSSSFPSDHATISMSIAVAMRVISIKSKNKRYKIFAIILTIFSLTMSFGRMMTAVHRPSDIIAGLSIGVIIPLLLSYKKPYQLLEKYIFLPLIKLETIIFISLLKIYKKFIGFFTGKVKG